MKKDGDGQFVKKLLAFAHSKPQLPVFNDTHLPTFKKQGANTNTQF